MAKGRSRKKVRKISGDAQDGRVEQGAAPRAVFLPIANATNLAQWIVIPASEARAGIVKR
jgi:hypothetical protein